jgi:hypothetical protein
MYSVSILPVWKQLYTGRPAFLELASQHETKSTIKGTGKSSKAPPDNSLELALPASLGNPFEALLSACCPVLGSESLPVQRGFRTDIGEVPIGPATTTLHTTIDLHIDSYSVSQATPGERSVRYPWSNLLVSLAQQTSVDRLNSIPFITRIKIHSYQKCVLCQTE